MNEQANKGVLFGVGVGPGDPRLLTLAAVDVIRACPVIALPDAGKGKPLAAQIAREYIREKELLYLSMPMQRDREAAIQTRQAAAERVIEQLEKKRDVAFLTLGDPAIYSTFLYLLKPVKAAGYQIRIIPGVPSFCAAAAVLGTGLCEGSEPLHILPGSLPDLEDALDLTGTKVLLKTGKQAKHLFEKLEKRGWLKHTAWVENCGLPGEGAVSSATLGEEPQGYFTTVIVKEAEG